MSDVQQLSTSSKINQAASQASLGRYLNLTTEKLAAMIDFIKTNYGGDRNILHAETRPLPTQQAAVAAAVPMLKPEILKIGSAPEIATYQPGIEQEGGNLTTLATLLGALKPDWGQLAYQAIREDNVLKGVA